MAAREDTRDEVTCRPCRGTGKVTSGLGGEQTEQQCPWCGGTGERQPGRDAQEAAIAARTGD
jgi:DnaJ-class molecular chaperone